jgi:uncharacterized protein (TIGR02391 family)
MLRSGLVSSIHDLLPNADILLALEPEELAGHLLAYLNALTPEEKRSVLNRHNFTSESRLTDYPQGEREAIQKALMEVWMWLEREGMLAPLPSSHGEWVFITRRGQQMPKAEDLSAYRRANVLPKELLHGSIASKVWSQFLRGDYDTAIFVAFKEVEVSVRTAAGIIDPEKIGVALMRLAFTPPNGALVDRTLPISEQEARAHLFAGAIGSYKNPQSHRHVEASSAHAIELLILASHLLTIIDDISQKLGPQVTATMRIGDLSV